MSKTVLLVEDNDFIRNMYQLKLAKSGIKCIEAVDGAMALAKIPEAKPDLVLLDLMMPNVSGLEVLEQLRASTVTPKLPVLILTNIMDQPTIDKCKVLGACDYIVKTDLTPKEVVEKIKQYI